MNGSPLALEIRDTGLLWVGSDGPVAPASPGYALLEGADRVFGARARAMARLKPRQIHNRFWHDFDREPLPAPFPPEVTTVDLAYGHLLDTWAGMAARPSGVILAVPGDFTAEQHGLLLGIARACSIPVEAMVDSALAASLSAGGGRILHVDLALHQAIVTEMIRGDEIVRRRVETIPDRGYLAFQEAVVKGIARAFVRRTRFDPLHAGVTEQALWDRLPEWLPALASEGALRIEVSSSHGEHAIDWTLEELIAATGDHVQHLARLVGSILDAEDRPATLVMSWQVAELPGLAANLARLVTGESTHLAAGAAGLGALAEIDNIRSSGEAVPFVTRLPSSPELAAPTNRPAEAARPSGRTPTHLLWGDTAYPLTSEELVLGTAETAGVRSLRLTGAVAGVSRSHCSLRRRGSRVVLEDRSTYGTFLNDRRVKGSAEVSAGDRLRLGSPGIELQLIATEEDRGPA